jgi:hypothetical protein
MFVRCLLFATSLSKHFHLPNLLGHVHILIQGASHMRISTVLRRYGETFDCFLEPSGRCRRCPTSPLVGHHPNIEAAPSGQAGVNPPRVRRPDTFSPGAG